MSKTDKAFARICDEIDKDPSRKCAEVAEALGMSSEVVRTTLWRYGQKFSHLKTERIKYLVKFHEQHEGFA